MEPAIAPLHPSLDTLASHRNSTETGSKKEPEQDRTLLNRARAKLITNTLVLRLVDVKDSPLHQAYWNTYHCATSIEQRGKTLKTKYCKNRWCMVCNRIRTALLIKGYEPALKQLQDPQFITLTFPNVRGGVLREEIEGMGASMGRIIDRLRKQGIKLKGIRKLECTYNPNRGDFNPHYHLIVEGNAAAKILVGEWLKEYPTARKEAQDIKPANAGTIMELMKYFTKILPSKGSRVNGKVEINPKSLDTMFQAMKGVQVFRAIGIRKQVSEEIENLEKKEYDILEQEYAIWIWEQDVADWLDFISHEPLTKYEPEPVTMNFIGIIQDCKGNHAPG